MSRPVCSACTEHLAMYAVVPAPGTERSRLALCTTCALDVKDRHPSVTMRRLVPCTDKRHRFPRS